MTRPLLYPKLYVIAYRVEKTVTDTSTSRRSIPDGYTVGDVVVTIDEKMLQAFARSALRNKTGRKVAASGMVVAKVRSRQHVETLPEGAQ